MLLFYGILFVFLFLFYLVFRSLRSTPRSSRLPKDVLITSWFSFHWTTLRLNSLFDIPRLLQPFLRIFYHFGTAITLLLFLPLSPFYYQTILSWLLPLEWQTNIWSLPEISRHIPPKFLFISHYTCIVGLAVAWHELGHGLAAAAWNVPLRSVGVGWMGLFPWAALHFRERDLLSVSPWVQLSVATAGIWHHLVTIFLTLVLLTMLPGTANEWRVIGMHPSLMLHIPLLSTLKSINSLPVDPAWFRTSWSTAFLQWPPQTFTFLFSNTHAPDTLVVWTGDPGHLVFSHSPHPYLISTLYLWIQVNFSVALVNILPLPKLDGSHLFKAVQLVWATRKRQTTVRSSFEK